MGVIQTAYSRTMERGFPGDKATAARERTDSYIVTAADGLAFGVAAMRGSADDTCVPGAESFGEHIATLNGQLAAGATALVLDAVSEHEQYDFALIQIDDEILMVTAQTDDENWTVERSVSGSAASAHADNSRVYLTSRHRWVTNFLGIARTDRAKTSPDGDRYVQNRVAGIMSMGDIYVRVIDAVVGGDAAMVRLSDGRVTKRTLPVPVTHASIDAFFDDSAAAGGIATLCLQGDQGRAQN